MKLLRETNDKEISLPKHKAKTVRKDGFKLEGGGGGIV